MKKFLLAMTIIFAAASAAVSFVASEQGKYTLSWGACALSVLSVGVIYLLARGLVDARRECKARQAASEAEVAKRAEQQIAQHSVNQEATKQLVKDRLEHQRRVAIYGFDHTYDIEKGEADQQPS